MPRSKKVGSARERGGESSCSWAVLESAKWLQVWPPQGHADLEPVSDEIADVIDRFERTVAAAYGGYGGGTVRIYQATAAGWVPTTACSAIPSDLIASGAMSVSGTRAEFSLDAESFIHGECVQGWFKSEPLIGATEFLEAFVGANAAELTFVHSFAPYAHPYGDILFAFLARPPSNADVWWSVSFAGCTD